MERLFCTYFLTFLDKSIFYKIDIQVIHDKNEFVKYITTIDSITVSVTFVSENSSITESHLDQITKDQIKAGSNINVVIHINQIDWLNETIIYIILPIIRVISANTVTNNISKYLALPQNNFHITKTIHVKTI